MADLKTWLRALRAPFFTATVFSVFLGTAIAWNTTGAFSWILFVLTAVGIASLNAGTNLGNDYYDHRSGNDELNRMPTPFSGGSRVIQEGLVKPEHVLAASLLFFALGSLIGLYLNYVTPGNTILLLGAVGVLFSFFYTAEPIRIGYLFPAEAFVGAACGPAIALGSYYVQAGALSWTPVIASLPVGALVALILLINEFQDAEADASVGKRTLVVRLGKKKAVGVYHAGLAFTYLFLLAALLAGKLPSWTAIALLTLPLALRAYSVSKKNYEKVEELLPANKATIASHASMTLLLTLGFVLDKII